MSHSSNEDEHSSLSRSPYAGPVLSGTGVETIEGHFGLGDYVHGGKELGIVGNNDNRANKKTELCKGIIDVSYYASSDQVIENLH